MTTQTWTLAATDYQQLSEVEHLLKRPGMYIGTVERQPRSTLCMDENAKISMKSVNTSVGEEHLFKEIIGNIADNVQRSRENNIDPGPAEITMDPMRLTAKNYGMFIPIERHPQTGKWIHDMVFGSFRAGSNFDDTKQRLYIGQNGIGAKGVNGFCSEFRVTGGDPLRGLKITIIWYNNMSQKTEPVVEPYTGPGFTEVSYILDFPRFGVASYDSEIVEIYRAHCAGLSYACQIPIQFNGQLIQVADIFEYAKMFYPITKASAIMYKDPNGVYELCIVDTPNNSVGISFVNGISTPMGGVHLDASYRVVTHALIDYMGKAVKGISLTKRDIVDHVSIFVACRLSKPNLTGQTKDYLKSPEPKIELPEKLLNGIRKWELVKLIYSEIERKQMNKLKKTDGKRKRYRGGKAEPANWAGTANSMQTVFILTEGDSADAYRLKFISQVPNGQGRNIFGSMPLHGKIRNVINSSFLEILENEDFNNIKQHLGLSEDTDYKLQENYRKLNYGALWHFPDPDNDGKHILGLLLLYLMARFPSLIEIGFLKFLRIPVARVEINGQRYLFYTMNALKRALAALPPGAKVGSVDYFKGLGSSEDHHIKEDFANPRLVTFRMDAEAIQNMLKAFHKKQAHLRKEWILNWVNESVYELENMPELPISVFVNHELIDYSIENVIRSIPEMMDGLKESQRKALFAAFRKLRGKKAKGKIKVAQVASHAAEITCYKHGEGCLADTIVMMTYNFVGSNNLPYFQAKGQFGCVDPMTPILTWQGTRKYAKDITSQDILVGDDGKPRHISQVVSGTDHMYTIHQKYGAPYKVNSLHILTLRFTVHKIIDYDPYAVEWSMKYYDVQEKKVKTKRGSRDDLKGFAAGISDENIFDIDVQTFLSFPHDERDLFHSVCLNSPIQWEKREVSVDPYELGFNLRNESLTDYILNDQETRLQLLAGLIDSHCDLPLKYIEQIQIFHLIHQRSDEIEFIAKSLGFKTTRSSDSLIIDGNIYRIPTRLSHKQATKKTCDNFIGEKITIEYSGPGDYVGWYIDANERFLLGDFTVTHNTRNKGGEDAANPRYTAIALPYTADLIYPKEDKRLERRIVDEGDEQECENFFPILPMQLMNGGKGIGSGWSTDIPSYAPLDLGFWFQVRLLTDLHPEANYQLPILKPYYKGFTGQIILTKDGYRTEGRLTNMPDGTVHITELPIGTWTKDYDDYLAGLEEEKIISGYDSYCTDEKIHFVIHKYLDGAPTLKKLKLISDHSFKNMTVLYRTENRGIQPRIYNNVPEMMEDFYKLRLSKYVERKELIVKEIDQEITNMSNRARFIHLVAIEQSLEIRNRSEVELSRRMAELQLPTELLDQVKAKEFCQERITQLHNKIRDQQEYKARMEQVRPQQIWYQEIEDFIQAYCKHEKLQRSTYESCNPVISLTIDS